MDKVEAWFHQALAETEAPIAVERGLGALRLGMQATGELERTRRNLLPS